MSQLSHPVKAERVSIVTTKDHATELHAEGCAHEAKALRVSVQNVVPSVDDGYEDDWYYVAPCARKAVA